MGGNSLCLSLKAAVSGKGTDSGDCSSPAKPCRTFQFAVNQTSPGGEVKALDPADYSSVVDGAGIDTKGGNGIALNPSVAFATINLANLLIQNVSGSGTAGIGATGPALTVTITHCTVRGFNIGINTQQPYGR